MSGHYVQLCPNPLRFEPVTKENSVFFDEANRQVRQKEFFLDINEESQFGFDISFKETSTQLVIFGLFFLGILEGLMQQNHMMVEILHLF